MTPHNLPPLPYAYDALEPWIDEHTMRVHYEQHHGSLVQSLNEAEARLEALHAGGDSLVIQLLQRQAVKLAGAHLLHRLFWETMAPDQGGQPTGTLADQINEDFGSFGRFKARYAAAASGIPSGGWVVLAWQPASQRLTILTAEGYALPAGVTAAVLALDVCEHAYYRKYEHRRAEYVHNWWNAVNWPRVGQLFATAMNPSPPEMHVQRRRLHVDQTLRTALATSAGSARPRLRAG